MTVALTWLGIAFCITQSAIFSGLNLAIFSLSRLRLETAAEAGDVAARKVLALRRDTNYTLVTILWGNVAINVLLTLLADSLMTGITAFLFSSVVITFLGEIFPQAYFSRFALPIAARLAPLLRFYQILLWPIARPVGKLLDAWVGSEGIPWFREADLSDVLRHHARSEETEVSHVEAIGAINFLALDDILVGAEGEPLDPLSIMSLPIKDGLPVFPQFKRSADDPFLQKLNASDKKWVVVVDEHDEPRFAIDTHSFLRGALFWGDRFRPLEPCHHPLIVRDTRRPLGQVMGLLAVSPERPGDDVIDEDLILIWTPHEKRIITGSDILGRLLRGIARIKGPSIGHGGNSPHDGLS